MTLGYDEQQQQQIPNFPLFPAKLESPLLSPWNSESRLAEFKSSFFSKLEEFFTFSLSRAEQTRINIGSIYKKKYYPVPP